MRIKASGSELEKPSPPEGNKTTHMPTDLCCGYKGFSLFLEPLQLTVKQLQSFFIFIFNLIPFFILCQKNQQLSFTSLSSFRVFRKLTSYLQASHNFHNKWKCLFNVLSWNRTLGKKMCQILIVLAAVMVDGFWPSTHLTAQRDCFKLPLSSSSYFCSPAFISHNRQRWICCLKRNTRTTENLTFNSFCMLVAFVS